jgi:hypothetical protein
MKLTFDCTAVPARLVFRFNRPPKSFLAVGDLRVNLSVANEVRFIL